MSARFTEEFNDAIHNRRDCWVPASGGTEEPFTSGGTRWLYVFNPALEAHAYLNLDNDIVYDGCPELGRVGDVFGN